MRTFEAELSVAAEELEFELRGHASVPWSDFLLNPRRLRGSDFLMRWSQGRWSEELLIEATNRTSHYFALPYGPSSTAPDDVREFELYFERLDTAGIGDMKRPDLLVFRKSDEATVRSLVAAIGGAEELPFVPEESDVVRRLLSRAVIAVECENSLWRATQMPHFGSELRPMRRLGGEPGLPKNAVLPTVIIKEEDRARLRIWQQARKVSIHIWHVFYDLAFGIPFDQAEELIASGRIDATQQTFQAPGGATSRKAIYKIYYHYAYPLGKLEEEPSLVADHITDPNGHILPYVRFEGGSMSLSAEALDLLESFTPHISQ